MDESTLTVKPPDAACQLLDSWLRNSHVRSVRKQIHGLYQYPPTTAAWYLTFSYVWKIPIKSSLIQQEGHMYVSKFITSCMT